MNSAPLPRRCIPRISKRLHDQAPAACHTDVELYLPPACVVKHLVTHVFNCLVPSGGASAGRRCAVSRQAVNAMLLHIARKDMQDALAAALPAAASWLQQDRCVWGGGNPQRALCILAVCLPRGAQSYLTGFTVSTW